jgi:hypothetical protein
MASIVDVVVGPAIDGCPSGIPFQWLYNFNAAAVCERSMVHQRVES